MSRTLLVCLIVAVSFHFRVGLAGASPTVKGDTESGPASGWADVSDTLGFPLGGLGTGFCAFGRYGFVHVNFDGRPRDSGHGLDAGEWEYTAGRRQGQCAGKPEEG